MARHQLKRVQGFTLIEAGIVVGFIGLVAAVAVPTYFNMAVETQLATASNSFISAVARARSSAITLKAPVTILPIDGNWSEGWKIILDETGMQLADFPLNPTLKMTQFAQDVLKFNSMGAKSNLKRLDVRICSENGLGRLVTVTGVGIARAKKIDQGCKI